MNREQAPRVSKRRVKEHLASHQKLAEVYNISFDTLDDDLQNLKTQINNKISLKEFIFFLHTKRMFNLKTALGEVSTKKEKKIKKKSKKSK